MLVFAALGVVVLAALTLWRAPEEQWELKHLQVTMDVCLLHATDEQIAKIMLFMPWVARIHLVQPEGYADVPSAMSSSARVVRAKIPFHEYCLTAPFLAERFLLVRNWAPSQFLFAFDFFRGDPIVRRHRTDCVPFTRQGFNHGFFFLPQAMSSDVRNFENMALERMQLSKRLLFSNKPLPSSDVEWRAVFKSFHDTAETPRVVLLTRTNDAHVLLCSNTLYVVLAHFDTPLQFLKRTIVKKAQSVDATKCKTAVQVVQQVREKLGAVTVECYGDINNVLCQEIGGILNAKLQPIPKFDTTLALAQALSTL